MESIKNNTYGNLALAQDHRKANYINGSDIEIIETFPEDLNIQNVILDHDGTISTLREGWEIVMHEIMMNCICGLKQTKISVDEYNRISSKCQRFIDETTGIQTIVQMQGLRELVLEEGLVPESEVKSGAEYKSLYLDNLMVSVRDRIERFQRGERNVYDFTLHGAINLLQELRQRKLKLYLASGTDENDVVAEANALGYGHFFNGGIRGSKGNEIGDAKRIVIDRIIEEGKCEGSNLMIIGDGPVEIKEGRRVGALCVGVASDEIRRHGINFSKRTRLIKAGAHIVIPDFSQLPLLLKIIFEN